MRANSLPLVSVIIPVFDGMNYLREAIECVLVQTYRNRELIVIDDGSTDETWAMIHSYGSRVRGIHKENGGVASAMNAGIREAKGQYIAWLSHDDLWLPEKLERQIDFLQQSPQFKACYTDYFVIDHLGNALSAVRTPWYPRALAMRVMFTRMYLSGSTMLIGRECFDRVGLFSEALRYTQDAEMWLRILCEFEIGRVPELLAKERVHRRQGSRHLERHHAEALKMYGRMFEHVGIARLFPEYASVAESPRVIARAHTWFGEAMMRRGGYALADKEYARAITIDASWRNRARLMRMLNRILPIVRPAYLRIRVALDTWARALIRPRAIKS